jgi:tRNA(fMet)-specific endonuclease VapC
MDYMLDTNICIDIMKNHPPKVQDQLKKIPVGSVSISAVVLAELWHGVHKSLHVQRNTKALKDFLKFLIIEDWPKNSADLYGKLRAQLEKNGNMIGANDLLIAAHALHRNATLVTNNLREFQRIDGLKVENWV